MKWQVQYTPFLVDSTIKLTSSSLDYEFVWTRQHTSPIKENPELFSLAKM
ncbi:hypothetical protein P8935_17530 [Telmatobacter sp. DSM 110680]|uniref:Uncharacterized protein n=1 Tax=Telmatobacter sp. DSM 110680 TaxID=3036704 RepID=A0AAU7DG94_9BACT